MQEVVSNNEHAHYCIGPVHDTILSTGNMWHAIRWRCWRVNDCVIKDSMQCEHKSLYRCNRTGTNHKPNNTDDKLLTSLMAPKAVCIHVILAFSTKMLHNIKLYMHLGQIHRDGGGGDGDCTLATQYSCPNQHYCSNVLLEICSHCLL